MDRKNKKNWIEYDKNKNNNFCQEEVKTFSYFIQNFVFDKELLI